MDELPDPPAQRRPPRSPSPKHLAPLFRPKVAHRTARVLACLPRPDYIAIYHSRVTTPADRGQANVFVAKPGRWRLRVRQRQAGKTRTAFVVLIGVSFRTFSMILFNLCCRRSTQS